MAQVTYPGVYVEEVSSGVRPIQAASTSTAAFIGVSEKGPLTEAVRIFNFTQYQNLFGEFLDNSYLTHSVQQFFAHGGSQCYIVRVSGENTETANIEINDRGQTPQLSLTIEAVSPGAWGNRLAIVIANGTADSQNEINIFVHFQNERTPLESFENLSMVPTTQNFVENVTASSNYIRVRVNQANTNVQAGTSRGGDPALLLNVPGRTRFRINLNGDGYQEVDVQDGVGGQPGQAADLSSINNIATAIQFAVRELESLRETTDDDVFNQFTCQNDSGVLVMTSGTQGTNSSVNVAPSSNENQSATGLLRMGTLEGGAEILGASVTRPVVNPNPNTVTPLPFENFFFVGDNAQTAEVPNVQLGSNGDPINNDTPYLNAFNALDTVNDVSLIAVPGVASATVMGGGMNYCANRSLSDCFFIGEMAQDDDTIPEIQTFWGNISPKNSYGAVYVPWVQVPDPTGRSAEPIAIPPSGFVAGLYARTDATRGVWKAPAGASVGLVASGVTTNFTDVQQGLLNPLNINAIRQFSSSGIVLWGSRTITSDPEYRYIPVRRMAIFLRVSIYNSIQWAVFEPNDEDLWASLRLNIGAFMMTLFRQGAFQGSSPSKAFFVKVDEETTTQADRDQGIVNVLIGFAALKPAEFVVVKISQMAGQSSS